MNYLIGQQYEFPQSKVSNVQPQLEKLIEKNYYLNRSVQITNTHPFNR